MSFPPPSVPQESPATPTKIKPGKGWYWLGALLLAGGLLGGLALAVAGFLNLKNTVEDFGRFKVTNGQGRRRSASRSRAPTPSTTRATARSART